MSAMDLKRFALFEELSEEEREVLADELERIELEPGDVLFREREEASGLVLVVEGRVRLESSRAGELGSVGPGDRPWRSVSCGGGSARSLGGRR